MHMSAAPTLHRRLAAALRLTAWGLAVVAALYGAGQVAARLACRNGALRGRLVRLLEARLGSVELGPEVHVDPLFRVRFGPLTVPATRPGAPLVQVDTLLVRPDLGAIITSGRAVPESVLLEGVRATFTLGGRPVTAGPFELKVRPGAEPDGRAMQAEVRLPGGGHGTVEVARAGEGWRAVARLEELDRRVLPAELPAVAQAWAEGTLAVSVNAEGTPAAARARLEVRAQGLHVAGPLVGAEPIGPLALGFSGDLTWDGAARRLSLAGGRLELPGGEPVAIDAELRLADTLPVSVRARADRLDFLRTADALPPALALPSDAPRPEGTLDARLAVSGPLLDPAEGRVDAALDLSRMRERARAAQPVALRGPFVQRAEKPAGPPHEFLVGPANPDFVPVAELPPWVVRAVTSCEDAGFFFHSGFDFAELRNAAVEGARAGRVVRGGSTISQQLAKNLYLSREKTLARKVREAMLTVALESTVPKQRLLEIYLNVAEWGPGVWGIGPAARHWFGKDARELTPREAAFLALVIPNPIRYHYMWNRGTLSDAWELRVDDLLRELTAQGTLTVEELAAALVAPLPFARPEAGPKRARPSEPGVTYRGT
jgi:hypothetical protein